MHSLKSRPAGVSNMSLKDDVDATRALYVEGSHNGIGADC